MANHLIIGLGGTGGCILREFRKRVYQEFRSNEPNNGIHLEYLYVDSSDDDLNSRDGWKTMGKSVHLKEAQKVSIHGLGLNMFQNMANYPGIRAFLNESDVEMMKNQLGPLVTAGIGGQRRRLGRTLFANNLASLAAGDGSDFLTRVKNSVNRIQQDSNDQMVTFHICAGLAGGTGSGSIIDAISQIRQEYKPVAGGTEYRIYLYLYVPEINVVNPRHDSGFYQANGYAALCELNAMSVGKYHPLDITGKRDNFTGEVRRLLDGINAFDAAYLYTNVNEAGRTLNIRTALPAATADFLFQKTVASENSQMNRLVGCENDGAGPEKDNNGDATRSRKFMSFGIRSIEYPESEIEECVTYNLARQAARQLQFNFWQDGIGYGERSMDEIGTGYRDTIKNKKTREELHLSNSHLMLSKPIIENEGSKRWRDIDETWESRTQMFADEVQKGEDKKSWFAVFTKRVDEYFDNNYRSHGVKQFYEIQSREIRGYASALRRHIEKYLFDQWHAGTMSLIEAEKYSSILIEDCRERITAFKQQASVQEEEAKKQTLAIKDINDEWENIGWLRDAVTGASRRVFAKYKTAKCRLAAANTRIIAYAYASTLMQEVVVALNKMLDGMQTYHAMLTDILNEASAQADSKCSSNGNNENTIIIKKYDPDRVQSFIKECLSNRERQDSNCTNIRTKMVNMLGEDGEHSFATLLDRTDFNTAIDIILDECEKTANRAMEDAAANDPVNKLVGVNILEKLRNEYNSEEKLETLVRGWVQEAQCYVQFNQEEQNRVFENAGGGMMRMIQLRLPRFDEDKSNFRGRLVDMVRQICPTFNPAEDLSDLENKNQIQIIAAASGFPLRFISNTKVLKERYDYLLRNPTEGALNRMALHTESFTTPLPELFEMGPEEIEEMMRKPILLGYAMGLFVQKENPETGEHFDAVNFPNDWGDNWERMGKDIFSSLKYISNDFKLASKIKAKVDQEMAQVRSNDQKAALRRKLGMDVVNNLIKNHPSVGGNDFSPIYKQWRAIAQEIMESELKDL